MVGLAGPAVSCILMPQQFDRVVRRFVDQLVVFVVDVRSQKLLSQADDACHVRMITPPGDVLVRIPKLENPSLTNAIAPDLNIDSAFDHCVVVVAQLLDHVERDQPVHMQKTLAIELFLLRTRHSYVRHRFHTCHYPASFVASPHPLIPAKTKRTSIDRSAPTSTTGWVR